MAGSTEVSMVMPHTLRTSAMERMLAREWLLNQTSPKFLTCPICVDNCVPPFVCTRRTRELAQMFERRARFLKTETVDWLLSKIQEDGMRLQPAAACAKVKALS
jgi:hypothetical protein